MIRFKHTKRSLALDNDTLTRYCNGEIEKGQAIREICQHNKIDLVKEEEFDKEIKSLGWFVKGDRQHR